MKTASVRELRNNYAEILRWVGAGEEVQVTRRGQIVARVVPPTMKVPQTVDWSRSAALTRAPWTRHLTAEQSASILAESQGD
ncbi:type II toxin-antitoxin system prevent-host-death family antitoxin [Opitutus sp. ER46]|uniref:type II toxin-antitoxin system Phd/YefM family antitoxin n=1 Tax=Opitutus sp. ER46 TaxID=2161864 RepID=UPI000D2F5BC0|nr:type II toxin-antitoxin system prevent-host-death family antitoxin [Opitutus sp. ER46]PTY01226.1 prevent-host-death protein [Opitutus sp. ER46]